MWSNISITLQNLLSLSHVSSGYVFSCNVGSETYVYTNNKHIKITYRKTVPTHYFAFPFNQHNYTFINHPENQ